MTESTDYADDGCHVATVQEIIHLDTAEDLLRELNPGTGRLWQRPEGLHKFDRGILFRGQGNEASGELWPLQSSAFRKDAFLKFLPAMVAQRALPEVDHRELEHELVINFAAFADLHGYPIPHDSPELRDPRTGLSSFSAEETFFPPKAAIGMYALAQHHGVPTRLLDWSTSPLVAAYFACEGVAKRREPGKAVVGDAPFSVFALRREVEMATEGRDDGISNTVFVMSAPRATNRNLLAQQGVFTLVQPVGQDRPHPLPTIQDVLRDNEAIIHARDGSHRWCPLLTEFRVPAREACTLLMLLAESGFTAATIYPGLDGVRKALEERRYFQYASPGGRS